MIGCYVLMMYYTTVSGWMLSYFFKFATGKFTSGMDKESVGNVFQSLLSSPKEMGLWMAVTVVLGFLVCSQGLQKGVEKISKYMMSALLLLIVILAVHCMLLPGAGEGIKFYLIPDAAQVAKVGIWNVIAAAMNQAFFTLSLGIAAMEIFGSYMDRQYTLTCSDRGTGYFCGTYVRTDHFSGLFFLRRTAGCRTIPDLCYSSQYFCKYGRRKDLGIFILPVYDICKLFNGYGGF